MICLIFKYDQELKKSYHYPELVSKMPVLQSKVLKRLMKEKLITGKPGQEIPFRCGLFTQVG